MGRKRKASDNGMQDCDNDKTSIACKSVKCPQCIIHSPTVDLSLPVNPPKDLASWKNLLDTAKKLNYHSILNAAASCSEDAIPSDVVYHNACRSILMLKERQKEKKLVSDIVHSGETPNVNAPSSSTQSVSDQNAACIFCLKDKYATSGNNSREPLVVCKDICSDEKVKQAAIGQKHSRIIYIISDKQAPVQVRYHHSCRVDFTRPTKHVYNQPESDYDKAEKDAYSKLFTYIRDNIIVKREVVKLVDIASLLEHFMTEAGYELNVYVKKNLPRKLGSEFKGNVIFVTDPSGQVLMYPDSLSRNELVLENKRLKDLINQLTQKDSDTNCLLVTAAEVLRDKIKESVSSSQLPWPPFPDKLKVLSSLTPACVTFFIKNLLGGGNKPQLSPKMQRSIESIGDDLIYAVSSGRSKPQKQISMAYAVKSLSGSVELIQILNRYNQCISYTQLEEIDTALALSKLGIGANVPRLPESLYVSIPTTLIWDNIDRLEETLSGGGTSHRVNGIAVQHVHYGPHQDRETPIIERLGQRTINTEHKLLPIYNAGTREGPPLLRYDEIDFSEKEAQFQGRNLFWVLARIAAPRDKLLASWTGFNILISDESNIIHDSIAYLPTINAPATELSTVQEILVQSKSIMSSLQLDTILVVFDQALYAKATEIIWKQPERFKGIVPRLGVFHTICNMLCIIGKRFEDAGLRDLCIDSGVIAEGSVAGVLSGRHYNRSIRFIKLMYEALMRLVWKEFSSWLETQEQEDKPDVELLMDLLHEFCLDPTSDSFHEKYNTTAFQRTMFLLRNFLDHLRKDQGDLSQLWMSFVDMAGIVLNLVHASRIGDWDLHLSSIRRMIPWAFAYDNYNYARYMSWYYNEMMALPKTHPELDEYLREGGFSVQRGESNPFGRIPMDQAIEETVNRDTQTGGTRGFSLKPGAVCRYYLTSEYRSGYLHLLKDSLGLSSSQNCHKDLQRSRIQRDESDVEKLVAMMDTCWINPFSPENTTLVGLSSGVEPSNDIKDDMLKALEKGEMAYKVFREERLDAENPGNVFHGKMKKLQLKTFSSIKRSKPTTAANGQKVMLKYDNNAFGHMILIAESRKLCMKEVLSRPVGPLPWSLSTCDGTPRKTNKASLNSHVQKGITPANTLGTCKKACVIDAMGTVQRLKGDKLTFEAVSGLILAIILREGADCKRIDFITDVYKGKSIKQIERVRRGQTQGTEYRQIAPGHVIYQWRKFLQNPQNKNGLIEFLVAQWRLPKLRKHFKGKELYATCGQTCYKITSKGSSVVPALRCNHEEADTRLFVHAAHASKAGYQTIIMVSEDTDVMVLSLAHSFKSGSKILIKQGTKARTKYVDVSKVAAQLGENVSEALVGLHAFTGCDTVSAFAGKGKVGALKAIQKHPDLRDACKLLGKQWVLTPDLFNKLQILTCKIYQAKTTATKVNDLRYGMFCLKKGNIESWQLPPCEASLWKHCLRSNYQAAIWRSCRLLLPDIPSPLLHGWCLDENDNLMFDWFDGLMAPDALLQLMSCKCPRQCKAPDCSCIANGMKCMPACKNAKCANQKVEEEEEEEFEEEMVVQYVEEDESEDEEEED